MQFITTDQRIAVENFEVGLIYTVTFSNGDSFTGACIGIGTDFVAFQRTAPKLLFCLTMAAAADVASIEPLGDDIGKILEYTGTVPTTIKTDGSLLLDYLITGNTIQNGTPTPDNPVMPEGTGERTENLWNEEYPNISGTIRYIPLYVGEGSFTVSTTTPNNSGVANIFLLSGNVSSGATTPGNGAWFRHNVTAQSDDGYVTIAYRNYTGTTSPVDCQTMLNSGSTALPYEAYGYKIPISSASTTTPVYLGKVETTRKIKKLVLTGTNADGNTNVTTQGIFYITPFATLKNVEAAYCTHFKYANQGQGPGMPSNSFTTSGGAGTSLWFKTNYTSVADFKAYLAAQYAAGTPVCVWYVLATPETAVVNEPLMRIGDYADTLSYRQSGVNIPTTDGLNIFDIDTTVKPSEVYLKYFSPLF